MICLVHGLTILPAAGIVLLAMEAIRQHLGFERQITAYRLKDVLLSKALVIPSDPANIETQLQLRPSASDFNDSVIWIEFYLYSCNDSRWNEIARGHVGADFINQNEYQWKASAFSDRTQKIRERAQERTACCNISQSPDRFYEYLQSTGIQYGPAFRLIKKLNTHFRQEIASADIQRSEGTKRDITMIQTCGMHPTTLDAMFQVACAAASRAGTKICPQMLPTQIKEMWIPILQRNDTAQAVAHVYAEGSDTGLRSTNQLIYAMDASTGNTLMTANLQLSFISDQTENMIRSNALGRPQLSYHINWKPDPKLLSKKAFQAIVGIASSDSLTVEFNENLAVIEKLCAIVCLRTISCDLQPTLLKAKPHLNRYIEWAKWAVQSSEHSMIGAERLAEPELLKMVANVNSKGIEGQLVARIVRKMPAILSGTEDALELLFQDSLLDDFYAYGNHAATLYASIAQYMGLLSYQNPDLCVLEIGAGTGSATAAALKVLLGDDAHGSRNPGVREWHFTDISSGFFEAAREKFRPYSTRMKFSVLDIEQDPVAQGFELGSYDVIVASNVFHATKHLGQTLRNARRLLKPDGILVLYEVVRPDLLYPGLVFGLLPGWWAASEPERQLSPLLSENQWLECLRAAGYAGFQHTLRSIGEENSNLLTAFVVQNTPADNDEHDAITVELVLESNSEVQSKIGAAVSASLLAKGIGSTKVVSFSQWEYSDTHGRLTIFLSDLEHPFLLEMDEASFQNLQRVFASSSVLLWPIRSATKQGANLDSSMVKGLSRVAPLEHDGLKMVVLSVNSETTIESAAEMVAAIFLRTLITSSSQVEPEYEARDGSIGILRLENDDAIDTHISRVLGEEEPKLQRLGNAYDQSLKLTIGTPGLLDTLHFVNSQSACSAIERDEIEIKVECFGLNFRDLLFALGRVNGDSIGLECSGVVTKSGDHQHFKPGDRVACLAPGSMRSFVRCKSLTAARIPPNVDFCSAAGLPVIFCTAYHVLVNLARIQAHESILIHSAAGGFGQAVVQLALMYNAEVFATVGDPAKKEVLIRRYGIGEDHIFSSRSSAFLENIKSATNGRGVDMVVNSLSGERLRSSWECVAPFGRFIEVGKQDIQDRRHLPMAKFTDDTSFFAVDLIHIVDRKPSLAGELLQKTISLFSDGKISLPVDFRIYDAGRIEEAFRFMQSGKATGKAVFQLSPDNVAPIIQGNVSTYRLDENATYVISGGLGGLGKSAAAWMVQKGARNLVLLSRRMPSAHDSETIAFIKGLEAQGTVVRTPVCDVAKENSLQSALMESMKGLPPIKGCIQAAMVLRDGRFQSFSLSDFQSAVDPKVRGSWNLHSAMPADLDFFVMLSSLSGLLGNHGQSNYASGNAYQDALAHFRVSRGQKAVSLDLGRLDHVGYVAEQTRAGVRVSGDLMRSSRGISEDQFQALLDFYCDPTREIPSQRDANIAVGLKLPADLADPLTDDTFWSQRPILCHLPRMQELPKSDDENPNPKTDDVSLLDSVTNLDDATVILCDALAGKLARSVDIATENVDTSKPLYDYAVDSLSAIELKKWIAKAFQAEVSVVELLGASSILSLSRFLAKQSRKIPKEIRDGGDVERGEPACASTNCTD
ncbi:MAG: hypothetical protein M1822_005903 [Bathelium mastoideum]|nr:MAG: hypothetical protein M1822_005903 [Bathelium mastoideum]